MKTIHDNLTSKRPGLHIFYNILRFTPRKKQVIALVFLCTPLLLNAQSNKLEIHHINVQQGDWVLVIGPNGTTTLIDAGKNGKGTSEVVPYLTSIGIMASEGLDYFIGTHYGCRSYRGYR